MTKASRLAKVPELAEALRGLLACHCGQPGGPEVAPGTACPHVLAAERALEEAREEAENE